MFTLSQYVALWRGVLSEPSSETKFNSAPLSRSSLAIAI